MLSTLRPSEARIWLEATRPPKRSIDRNPSTRRGGPGRHPDANQDAASIAAEVPRFCATTAHGPAPAIASAAPRAAPPATEPACTRARVRKRNERRSRARCWAPRAAIRKFPARATKIHVSSGRPKNAATSGATAAKTSMQTIPNARFTQKSIEHCSGVMSFRCTITSPRPTSSSTRAIAIVAVAAVTSPNSSGVMNRAMTAVPAITATVPA